MKKLLLLRHAKSSWDSESCSDHDRELSRRGLKNAKKMAARLSQRGVLPALIISSSAVRAKTTAEIMAKGIGYALTEIVIDPDAYTFEADRVMHIVREFDDHYASLMLVGHNPAFTVLANRFCNQSIVNVPTCGLLDIESTASSWQLIDVDNTRLTGFDYPKNKSSALHF